MIEHSYSIIRREMPQASSRTVSFAAEPGELHIVVDGLRIDNRYPNRECFGSTRVEAMISASDVMRFWLNAECAEASMAGSRVRR